MKQKMLSLHLSHIIVSSLPFVFKGFSSNEISDKKIVPDVWILKRRGHNEQMKMEDESDETKHENRKIFNILSWM